uniref:Uncharacterized protein n=1 Tax=Arundo donax TaxID=35708 RepID=A0A0A9FKQ3_ARUDO
MRSPGVEASELGEEDWCERARGVTE